MAGKIKTALELKDRKERSEIVERDVRTTPQPKKRRDNSASAARFQLEAGFAGGRGDGPCRLLFREAVSSPDGADVWRNTWNTPAPAAIGSGSMATIDVASYGARRRA